MGGSTCAVGDAPEDRDDDLKPGRAESRKPQSPIQAEGAAPVDRFLAGIAHELRNPLEGLRNALHLLRQHRSEQKTTEYVDIAEGELTRIKDIVTGLLDRYKGHATAPVTVAISEVIENTLVSYKRTIQKRKVQIEKRYVSCGLVEALPGQVRQVFTNLIVNALEAMPTEGRLNVRISNSRDWRDPKVHGVRIVIADNGIGIPRGNQKRIFSGAFTSKGDKGTGVGLWMAKRIVEGHSGSIRVRSSAAQGQSWTCFTIFLPEKYTPGPKNQPNA